MQLQLMVSVPEVYRREEGAVFELIPQLADVGHSQLLVDRHLIDASCIQAEAVFVGLLHK